MRLAIIAVLLAGVAMPALAQNEDESLNNRVYRIEKELREVQRKVFPGGNPQYFEPQITAPQAAPDQVGTSASTPIQDLSQRVTALEQQLQQITNQSEENGHRLSVLEQQFAKMKGDTDYRLNAIEQGGAAAAGGAAAGAAASSPPPAAQSGDAAPFGPKGRKPVAGKAAPPPPADSGSTMGDQATSADDRPAPAAAQPVPAIAKTGDPAEDGYMLGYTLWSQKRYADAETRLKQVVAKYPDHKRASYAQNLLGRSYYDDGDYTNAAEAFLTSYKKFPSGERAPDSLYYLGLTLTKLKKNGQACQVFDEFRDVYGANANATLKARVTQGRTDAKCGA